MKQNRVFFTFSLITGILFLTASLAFSASPMPVQRSATPAPAAPTVQPQKVPKQVPQQAPMQVPKQAVPVYSMSIENISLTGLCQVAFTLRNTGANISVEQHESSYLKIGQNPPMNLKDFDPAGRLRTKGQSKTNHLKEPITKDTNIIVELTLFNGKKITKSKFLKPTCATPAMPIPTTPVVKPKVMSAAPQGQPFTPDPPPPPKQPLTAAPTAKPNLLPVAPQEQPFTPDPPPPPEQHLAPAPAALPAIIPPKPPEPPTGKKLTPMQTGPQAVAPKGIPAEMTPKSGDSPMGPKLMAIPKQHISMPKTILQVERMGGDLQTWDSWAGTDTSVQKMDFRWKTEYDPLIMASWQVSLTPDFPYVIASGFISPIPPMGMYGRFSIDLGTFSGTYSKPATFFVRVQPIKLGGITAMSAASGTPAAATPASQPPASSSADDPGLEPSTAVRITLTEAGSGPVTEFHLPETHLKVVFTKALLVDDSDDLSGGDMGFKFTVNGEEQWKTFPDDKYDSGDMINLGNVTFIITDPPNFTKMTIMGCDNDDTPGAFSVDRCGSDPDRASVSYDIGTGKNMGRWKMPNTPFNLYAQGESLKFEVQGHYEMYCDPCP